MLRAKGAAIFYSTPCRKPAVRVVSTTDAHTSGFPHPLLQIYVLEDQNNDMHSRCREANDRTLGRRQTGAQMFKGRETSTRSPGWKTGIYSRHFARLSSCLQPRPHSEFEFRKSSKQNIIVIIVVLVFLVWLPTLAIIFSQNVWNIITLQESESGTSEGIFLWDGWRRGGRLVLRVMSL